MLKKFLNNKVLVICTSLTLIGLIFIIWGIIIKCADYKFSITLNNESYKFFVGETLYYRENVTINSDLNGFKVYVNNKKKKSTITLKDGNYHVVFKKHFYKVDFYLEINKTPSFYVVDIDNKDIHNYLSNTSPFKVIHNGDVKLENELYDDRQITEIGNYFFRQDDKQYNINILEAF